MRSVRCTQILSQNFSAFRATSGGEELYSLGTPLRSVVDGLTALDMQNVTTPTPPPPPHPCALSLFPRHYTFDLSAGAYGIGEAVTQVLDYLDCVYSVSANEEEAAKEQEGTEGYWEGSLDASKLGGGSREKALLGVYIHVLDGQGAAPGP